MKQWVYVLVAAGFVSQVMAGAKIEIDEQSSLDLGLRVQTLAIVSEKDQDGDGTFESDTDFRVRRGRLRLKGVLTENVEGFIQTDIGSSEGGSGYDWRVIDAWVSLKANDLLQLFTGTHMAPASRENLTSSGALLTMDRPGMNTKSLTWGTRSVNGFATSTYGDSDAGLRGDVDVRDTGATLFGTTSLTDELHLKYYVGAYDGVQQTEADEPRLAGRVQVNMMDAEPGYFNLGTYLGGKKTVAVGASVDTQSKVADSVDRGAVDYLYYTVDLFSEMPLGPGCGTLEAAYSCLDLDDATQLDHDGDPATAARDATRAQGDGYYVQLAYYVDQWQPWVEYEHWDSDAADGKGSYEMYRAGVSYFLKGHNANVKAGVERLNADAPIGNSVEDTIDSIVLGCYITY